MNCQNLTGPFSIAVMPDWSCPTCNKGALRILDSSFHRQERLHSRDHSRGDFDASWIEHVYACVLQCSNDLCREVVCNCGTGFVEEVVNENELGEYESTYVERFTPKFFEPPLILMEIPRKCSTTVDEALRESFRLFFSAPTAAANSVRIAIEQLLTELKVKRFRIVKNKRKIIFLHDRIGLLPAKHDAIKAKLEAIKWIGNA